MMLLKIKSLFNLIFYSKYNYALKIGVIIGKRCSINTRFWGSEPYLIEIGDDVQITAGVRFFTHGGGWVLRKEYPNFDTFGKIKIGNNVYIGNCCMIMPGVIIGNNVIIGSGSIVTKSIESNSIYGGNPARYLGQISDYKNKMQSFNLNTYGLSFEDKKRKLLGLEDKFFIKK